MSLNSICNTWARCQAIAVSVINKAPHEFAVVLQAQPLWIVNRLLLTMAIGGCMGLLGPVLAQASQHPDWGNILSGVLGASGAFSFEFLARWIVLLQPSS